MDIHKQSAFLSRKWRKYLPNEDKIVSATARSIYQIETELSISIPPEFILLSQLSLNYRAWFAGIGEDYDNSKHILVINRLGKLGDDESLPVPAGYVVINQGFDDDYDCISTSVDDVGVYYFNADKYYGGCMKKIAENFVDYLTVIA